MATEFQIQTAPFSSGESIPTEYTCEGEDISPSLRWIHPPEATRSFALIVDDPDAPGQTFTHWVLFNIPGDATHLPRDVDVGSEFDGQDIPPREGVNDFSEIEYGGPCPPPGDDPHRYFFRLYALDTKLDLDRGATREQLTDAMDGHILDETDLMGTSQR